MKKRIFKLGILAVLATATLTACSDDYLDTQQSGATAEDQYYTNETEAFSGLVNVYDIMKKHTGGFENMVAMLNAGSDDFYAGGGSASDGAGIQSFSNYTINSTTIPGSFWGDFYQGIFRANVLLSKLPNVPMDDATKARFTAETKALRAYYYFQLEVQFRNIPLILERIPSSEIYNITQADPADVYAQIEQDLTDAIADLPPTVDLETEAGRFTKGAAQALLGKVYLYEGKNAQAVPLFAEVNGPTPGGTSQYGYKLLANYADLWNIDNKFNTESILESQHTYKSHAGWGNWGSGSDEGNTLNVMVGPRGYTAITSDAPQYETGWSFNTVTQDLYDAMQGDPRFDSTIADLSALVAEGKASYVPGNMDTGYFLKKFMPTHDELSPEGGDAVLNYRQNSYIIRLADTYLMEAEALGGTGARAQALLDAVRARVGLPSVPVSLDAIAHERRLELAGEGHRWRDLVRTGKAATVLASRGFQAGKNEIWPIPQTEVESTLIEQNPNYN